MTPPAIPGPLGRDATGDLLGISQKYSIFSRHFAGINRCDGTRSWVIENEPQLFLLIPPTQLVGFGRLEFRNEWGGWWLPCRLSLNDPPTALVGF